MPSARKKPASSKKPASQQQEFKTQGLLGADRDAFIAAVEREPEAAPRLVRALRQHRRLLADRL
jgi:hypothetical protein